MPYETLKAYLFLTITALCWASNVVFGQLAVGEISPMLLVCLRWATTLLLIALFVGPVIRRDWVALRPHLPFLAIMGATGFTIFNALFYLAAHTTSGLNMGIIQGSIPIFVLIILFVVYRAPITWTALFGVMTALIGVVTVVTAGEFSRLLQLSFQFGDVLMVIACMLYAGYTVGLRRRPPVSAFALFVVLAASAFLAAVPLAALEVAAGTHQWPSAKGMMVVVLVAIIPSVIAQTCFIQGVDRLGPARAGIFVNLVPVFGSALVVLFLGEVLQGYHALSLALVLSGIWLSERAPRPVAVSR